MYNKTFPTTKKNMLLRHLTLQLEKNIRKFAKHESYQAHSEAFTKMTNKASIFALINAAYKKQQQARQGMLIKQLSSLQYLLHQGLGP